MRTLVAAISLTLVACHSGSRSPDLGAADAGAQPRPDGAVRAPLERVWLPQAIAGGLWANPVTYQSVPLHIATAGDATTVSVRLADQVLVAADTDGDGMWTALLPIADLGVGQFEVAVTGTGSSGEQVKAAATLGVGIDGVQFTSVPLHGNAGTPRLHRVGDALWLTWTDGRDGVRKAWLQRLDGLGRGIGEPVALVAAERDTLYARTAFGSSSVGVLYQHPGGPYENYFAVVDTDGNTRFGPIALDPKASYGSYGGDITFDGEAFVLVWRTNNGSGKSEIRWLRVTEAGGETTGPTVVASAGNDDPHGGFDPFSFIGVQTVGERSLVAFTRDLWDDALEFAIPRCQVAGVDAAGNVTWTERAAVGSGFWWDFECRVFGRDSGAVLLWSRQNLSSNGNPPPTGFVATLSDDDGNFDAGRGNGTPVLSAPQHRTEPYLIAGGAAGDVLVWTDERSYDSGPTSGSIQLYAAAVDDAMAAGNPVVFGHARFIESTAQLRGIAAGSNALLVWIDERHGNGITDPKPELYFETVWR